MSKKIERESHGQRHHHLYNIWLQMRYRCTRKNHPSYKNYGGRGIKCDPRWDKFSLFLKDMENSWKEGMSLDRIDNNGNYCKENCRFTDRKTQAINRRNTRFFEHDNHSLTLTDWASKLGMKRSTLAMRIYKYNWSVERTLTTII